jgi:hypothetical protein
MRKLLAICGLLVALACAPAGLPQNSNSNSHSGTPQTERGNPSVKVWVNTNSHVYHCPGTRWYGATKAGEYMTQQEAQDKGNRPAYGRYCQ